MVRSRTSPKRVRMGRLYGLGVGGAAVVSCPGGALFSLSVGGLVTLSSKIAPAGAQSIGSILAKGRPGAMGAVAQPYLQGQA